MVNKFRKLIFAILFVPVGWLTYGLSFFFSRKKIAVFGVHTGSLSGNVKQLYFQKDYLEDYKKVFIYRDEKILQQLQLLTKGREDLVFKSIFSISGFIESLRASCYVYSSYPSDICFWTSGGAHLFNVWHGTPLKKIERDVDRGVNRIRNKYWFVFIFIFPHLYKKPDKLLVSSIYEERCFKTAFDVDETVFVRAFPPRLTVLKDAPNQYSNRNILYCPTWRDDGSFCLKNYIDLELLNDFFIERKMNLIVKPHPSDKGDHIGKNYSNIVLSDKNEDIYSLLSQCGLVITDYSSIMFDSLSVGINVLIFAPDYEEYLLNNRDFYVDLKQLPFKVSYSERDLIKAVSNSFLSCTEAPSLFATFSDSLKKGCRND